METLSSTGEINMGWRRMIQKRALSKEMYTQFAMCMGTESLERHNLLPHRPGDTTPHGPVTIIDTMLNIWLARVHSASKCAHNYTVTMFLPPCLAHSFFLVKKHPFKKHWKDFPWCLARTKWRHNDKLGRGVHHAKYRTPKATVTVSCELVKFQQGHVPDLPA